MPCTATGRRLQPPSFSGYNLREAPTPQLSFYNQKDATTPYVLWLQPEGGYNHLFLPNQGIKFCSKIQSARNRFKSNERVGLIVANPMQLVSSQTDVGSERYSDLFVKSNR